MTARYGSYERLKLDWPEDKILRITMDNPGRLNAARRGHAPRADPYLARHRRGSSVSAAIIRGAGEAFSAGGDLDLVDAMTQDFETLTRVWKERAIPSTTL